MASRAFLVHMSRAALERQDASVRRRRADAILLFTESKGCDSAEVEDRLHLFGDRVRRHMRVAHQRLELADRLPCLAPLEQLVREPVARVERFRSTSFRRDGHSQVLRARVIEKRIRHRLGHRSRAEDRERVRHALGVGAPRGGARVRGFTRPARERCAHAHGRDD